MSKHLSETGLSHLIQKIKDNYISTADTSNFASVSEAISALSLTMDSEYKLTLSGRTADGSGFTVSDVIDLPLETMVVSGAYDSANTQIVLTLKNGNTTSFPVSALVDGLQSEITTGNTLSADLVSDGTTNKVVTGTDKTNWNNAYASAHTHSNKSVLDGIAANDITNWNNAYASAHTHSNKAVLDDISSSDVDKWDAAIQGITFNGETLIPDTGNVIDINTVSDVLVVRFSLTGDTVTCDTTIDEIFNAIESGKYVYGTFPFFGDLILRPTLYYGYEDGKAVEFSVLLQIGSDDEITPFTILGAIDDGEDVWNALNSNLTPIKANVIESISVNGVSQPITNKNVDITTTNTNVIESISVNGVNQPITNKNVDITAVTSINNKTGAVILNADDVKALPDYSKEYLTFTALEDTTFTFSTNALQYNLDDGTTWTTLAANTASPTVTAGNKILWKQTGLTPNSTNGIGTFSATGNFEASGNIMSLLYGDDFVGQTDLTGKNYTFVGLFKGNNKLVSAENLILPATTLASSCYYSMFNGCTSLTKAPELPTTTLASGCYGSMFSGCTSLTSAPELPATTLGAMCYTGMFDGCTSLTSAPELPATTLKAMCYSNMFDGCTNLNYIKCLATNINAMGCTTNWVNGVASTGTFVKADSMASWTTGNNGIPTNWEAYTESEYELAHNYQVPSSADTANWNNAYASAHTHTNKTVLDGITDTAVTNWNNAASSAHSHDNKTALDAITTGKTQNWDNAYASAHTHSNQSVLDNLTQGVIDSAHSHSNSTVLDNLTQGVIDNSHTHSNKTALDTITTGKTQNWDNAYASAHTHTNKSTLDGISSTDVTNWNNAASSAHSHSNSTVLDNLTQTVIDNSHTHSNKTALDAITTGKTANWDNAYASAHTHDNKSVLDDISSADVAKWDAAIQGVSVNGVPLTPDTGNVVDITVSMGGGNNNYNEQYLTFKALQTGTFTPSESLQYSLDGGSTWNTLESYGTSPTLSVGDEIMWKGSLSTDYCHNNLYSTGLFSSSGNFNAYGNVLSLFYGDNFIEQNTCINLQYLFGYCTGLISAENLILPTNTSSGITTVSGYCYQYMFLNCTSLKTAPELPATTLEEYCYYSMFSGCYALTKAPELPATTLATNCYDSMFSGCYALTKAPDLPAQELADHCYSNMFNGCSSLMTPPELPATILADYCYSNMFSDCTLLTTAPELPAQELSDFCYYAMFQNCASLRKAPELPALELTESCYQYMFNGCASLKTAPELPATTLASNCYGSMFESCTSLNYIKCLATQLTDFFTTYCWVSYVANVGTFVKADSMEDWTIDNNGIPTGWTVYNASDYEIARAYQVPSSADTANWNAAYASAHTHSNKSTLDGISSTNVTNWNNAASSAHSHTNKSALDAITTGKTRNWDNAYASAHTHSNAAVLNGISSTDVTNWNGVTAKTDSTTFGTHSATTIANGTSSQMHLPTVSASDNNKVLMVVNGVWTLVAPSMIYSGSGAPDNSQGNNGDLYIQTS